MKRLLTPRQAALSLGASESSLKRWCDRGELSFERTAGGHRKIPASAVVGYLRKHKLEAVKPNILGLPPNISRASTPMHDSIELLEDALVQGDTMGARRIVFEFYIAGYSAASICDNLLTPVMSLVGDRWSCGDVEIFEEHRAVELAVRLLHELRHMLEIPKVDAPTAMGGSVEGDSYGLPTRMVELALLECGWQATSLGTSLPFEALHSAVHRDHPRLFWLSASVLKSADSFAEDLSSFCDQLPSSTTVVIGGRAITDEIRERIGRPVFMGSVMQLAEYASSKFSLEATKAG